MNRGNWLILLLALLATIEPLSSAAAKDYVFAVDVSAAMGARCGSAVDRPLDLAKKRIKAMIEDFDAGRADNGFALLVFADKAHMVYKLADERRDFLPTLLRQDIQGGNARLSEALREITALLNETGRGKDTVVTIFTAGEGDAASVLDGLGEIAGQEAQVVVQLFTPGQVDQAAGPSGNGKIRIERIGCVDEDFRKHAPMGRQRLAVVTGGQGDKKTAKAGSSRLEAIKRITAGRVGIDVLNIADEADLLRDLGLDSQAAYEVLVELCSQFQVAVPAGGGITGLRTIAAYIDRQETDRLTGIAAIGQPAPAQGTSREVFETAQVGTIERDEAYAQEVFYGTNRQPTGLLDPADYYGGDRAKNGRISYGKCTVSIPKSHKKGQIESAFLGLKMFEDPKEHIQIRRIEPLPRDHFFKLLKGKIGPDDKGDAWRNDAVVFVHGFNVRFEEAAKRTAQMAYDFGFTGLPLFFSWPSDGKLYAYGADREDSAWSALHVEQFLNDVLDKVGPKRIHIVAHSMGNQAVIGALNLMALHRGASAKALFENVILAAPDFDAQLFEEQIAPNVVRLARGWTVYTSDKDAALNFSTTINSAQRLGLPVTPIAGVDVIDATGVEVTPWSVPEFHSYYATKQTVVEDIVNVIKGVGPRLRQLTAKKQGALVYWRLRTGL